MTHDAEAGARGRKDRRCSSLAEAAADGQDVIWPRGDDDKQNRDEISSKDFEWEHCGSVKVALIFDA